MGRKVRRGRVSRSSGLTPAEQAARRSAKFERWVMESARKAQIEAVFDAREFARSGDSGRWLSFAASLAKARRRP